MIKVLFATFVLCFTFALPCTAVESQQQWSSVAGEIATQNQSIRSKLANVSADISSQRHKLQQQLRVIKAKTKQNKIKAEKLQTSLQTLQIRENVLKKELRGKQDLLQKIEVTVRSNSKLILANNGGYANSSEAPTWYQQLELISTSDSFPALADIHLVNQTLLDSLSSSGQIKFHSETVFTRTGSAKKAQVVRFGNFQTLYQYGEEVGFLNRESSTQGLQVAAYVPDKETARLISRTIGQVTGNASGTFLAGNLPVDISNGKVINTLPASGGIGVVIKSGGLFLWPIMLFAAVGLLLSVERFIVLSRIAVNGSDAIAQVNPAIETKPHTPAEFVVHAIVAAAGDSIDVRESRMEEAILEQLPRLERFLQTIKVMATISPLLGLLGTVSGIIQTFKVISSVGNGDPKLLSAGISEALLTTEAGLLVAIPLLLCHHFLQLRVRTVVLDMELAGAAMLADPKRKDAMA